MDFKLIVETALLPPGDIILLLLLGWWLHARRVGRVLHAVGVLGLIVLSMPVTGDRLLAGLEGDPLDVGRWQGLDHAAIVVLAAEAHADAPEYGGPTVGGLTLERLHYAAVLQRATGYPILTSGGVVATDTPPAAVLMRETLEKNFNAQVQWAEDRSSTTTENARFSVALLRHDGITNVLLVTHAWHMKRAAYAFAQAGMKVIEAPTMFIGRSVAPYQIADFFPTANGLRNSYFGLHEWIGLLWYRLNG